MSKTKIRMKRMRKSRTKRKLPRIWKLKRKTRLGRRSKGEMSTRTDCAVVGYSDLRASATKSMRNY